MVDLNPEAIDLLGHDGVERFYLLSDDEIKDESILTFNAFCACLGRAPRFDVSLFSDDGYLSIVIGDPPGEVEIGFRSGRIHITEPDCEGYADEGCFYGVVMMLENDYGWYRCRRKK